MAEMFAGYSGASNTGYKQTINEDFISITELDSDTLLAMVADGNGGKNTLFQPAAIVCNQIVNAVKRLYKKDKKIFLKNARTFMEEILLSANDVLIAFKLGNEAENFGFASSISCLILERSGRCTFAHAGNTRIYMLKDDKIIQLTKDHTLAQELVDRGNLSADDYYTSMDRLNMYSGMGVVSIPIINTGQVKLPENTILLMSSDGLHYSLKEFAIRDITYAARSLDEAVQSLTSAAIEQKNFPDNISVNIIYYFGERKENET